MILAGELAGAFLTGGGCALVAVYFYARRVFRQKMGQLGSQLLGLDGDS